MGWGEERRGKEEGRGGREGEIGASAGENRVSMRLAWPASSAPLIWLKGAPRKVRGRSCGKPAAGIGAGARDLGAVGSSMTVV